MLKALQTIIYGVVIAVVVIAVALATALYVLGLAAKAALFGEPKTSLAVRLIERISQSRHQDTTGITDNTHHKEQ